MSGTEVAFAFEEKSSGTEGVEAERSGWRVVFGLDDDSSLLIERVEGSHCGAKPSVVQMNVTGPGDSSCRTLDGEASRQQVIQNTSVHHTFIRGSNDDSCM
jgi:hypothetical protein